MPDTAELCHCGKPLHYQDEGIRRKVDALILQLGTFATVTRRSRTWRVPRHYIALHGLKAEELAVQGFEEITAKKKTAR